MTTGVRTIKSMVADPNGVVTLSVVRPASASGAMVKIAVICSGATEATENVCTVTRGSSEVTLVARSRFWPVRVTWMRAPA
jgi:hypothetical protein